MKVQKLHKKWVKILKYVIVFFFAEKLILSKSMTILTD